MKIDSALQHLGSVQTKGVKSKPSKDKAGASNATAVSDDVRLTATSSRMRELEMQLAQLPADDAGKVEAVRQAIAQGTFQVDEEAVAEGMVEESIEQLRHRQQR